jgi:hypothetical protein
MSEKMDHTPSPWEVGETDPEDNQILIVLAGTEGEFYSDQIARVTPNPFYDDHQGANAAYIVQACNAFPALVKALKGCRAALAEAGKMFARESAYYARPNLFELHEEAARAALEKAGENV